MPSFSSPTSYMHLRMAVNESSIQLMTMQEGQDTPRSSDGMAPSVPVAIDFGEQKGTSPCFNGPSSSESSAGISYKMGKSPLTSTLQLWRSRSSLERFLVLFSISLLILIFVLLGVVVKLDKGRVSSIDHSRPFPPALTPSLPSKEPLPNLLESTTTTELPSSVKTTPTEDTTKVCTTPGCVRAANNLMNAMNRSASPCDNFFEFACGAWNRQHPIPDDMFAYGTFAFVREKVRQQLRVLLEAQEESTSRSMNMARTAYGICMNTTQLEALNTSLLTSALDDLGTWPLMHKEWAPENFELTSLLSHARKDYGTDVFFQYYVYADSKNTSQNTLFIDQGSLTLGRGSRDYYLNDTLFATQMGAYKKYIHAVMSIILTDANVTLDKGALEKDLNDLVIFETNLAKIIVPEDDRRNNTRMYNKMKMEDLYKLLPQVNWQHYFSLIAPPKLTSFFTNDTELIVCEIDYLKKMSGLIEETSPRVLTNYVLWRVVQSTVKFLDDRFENIKQDLMRVMTGQQTKSPRWKDCAQVPSTFLPLAAGAIYVKEHFDATDKQQALEMIGHLRSSFSDLVKGNDWMDQKTKEVAIEKVNSMINHIGYPDLIRDDKLLDEKYDKLEITQSDTYFGLMRKAVSWMQEKEFLKLLKPFDKFEFDVSPAVVNAFYSPEKNAITFPAGILQPPFFSGEYPRAVNYGAIGAVIGHEITHGFDDQGSQYDKNGNLQNWWNADSLQRFDERKKCIIDQYSNYTVPETKFHVNGKLTLGENIADNGGVKEAFRAYRKYVDTLGGEEPRLPGLQEYTNDQVFFLSYAHFWCGHKKQAAALQQVLTDEHSPELFRVVGVLSNLEEFAQAFSCQRGAPLNPVKKCTVW